MGIRDYEREREAKQKWLAELKAGDRVAVYSGGWNRDLPELKKVVRTTSQQIMLAGYNGVERKYRRKDGKRVGGSSGSYYSRESLDPITPELEAKIRLTNALYRLKNAKYETFDERLVLELARRVEAETARLEKEAP